MQLRVLYLTALLFREVALHVRYAYLGAHYVGEFKSEVSVSGVHDCTLLAFNEKRIGYRVTVNGLQITCALLTDFIRFAPVSDKNVRDYILSANLDNKICKVDMQRNVTEFVNGPCTFGGGDCSMLDKIKDYCIFVGTDKYNCISETEQDTVRSIECPAGQERVDLKKEKVLCCLKGELFIKEQDGKAFCCPRSKKLKEIVNGKAVCCSSTESHQPGASLCCAPGLTYSENNGTANCCKAGLLASKSKDGQVGCCPAGKEFGGMVDGKAICCNPGEIYESGKTFCCPPGTNYSIGLSGDSGAEGIERCCPPRTYPTKSESGDIGCCRDEYKFIRNDGTRDVCCFGSSNYEFHRMLDGKPVCCRKGTVFKGWYKDRTWAVCCREEDHLDQDHCCKKDTYWTEHNGLSDCCQNGTVPMNIDGRKYNYGCCKRHEVAHPCPNNKYMCATNGTKVDCQP
ncbi:hypothetical protein QR680_004229 [Steinernema hermaphroditum]|uniref:Uncharacterized protein n=1 Tax=Steinernema hermaphroditum TaxID=289476 RepID=A0AA39LTN7_9BILA|nr:hypothetical protein QR680_004229 [Steinernema hermaphroditum]